MFVETIKSLIKYSEATCAYNKREKKRSTRVTAWAYVKVLFLW